MDRADCERIVAERLSGLKEQLGLDAWEVRVSFEPGGADDDGFAKRGECTRLVDYHGAHVTFWPRVIEDEAQLLATLRHELFHMILAPFDLYTSLVGAVAEEGSEPAAMLDRVREHAIERCVAGLERMWAGLTDKQPP